MKYSKVKLIFEAIKHRGFISKIPAIFRMVKFWISGKYPAKTMNILMPILGIIYIISPIDIFPEFLFFLFGYADDLLLLSFILPKLMQEVDRFLIWEATRKYNDKNIIEAEIVS